MTNTVVMTKSAEKDLRGIPAATIERLRATIFGLAAWPNVSDVKALQGKLRGVYRVRSGEYRIFFTFANRVVTVTHITTRGDAY